MTGFYWSSSECVILSCWKMFHLKCRWLHNQRLSTFEFTRLYSLCSFFPALLGTPDWLRANRLTNVSSCVKFSKYFVRWEGIEIIYNVTVGTEGMGENSSVVFECLCSIIFTQVLLNKPGIQFIQHNIWKEVTFRNTNAYRWMF